MRRRASSQSQAADAWARCSAYAGEAPAPDSKGQNNDFRDAEADLTMKFAPTKTVERLDLQAAACVSGSLSVVMSADLLPMADIGRQGWHGRKVPEPDSHTAAKARPIRSPRRRRASTLSGISMRISSAQAQAVACVRRSALLVRSQHPSHSRRSASEKSVSRYD